MPKTQLPPAPNNVEDDTHIVQQENTTGQESSGSVTTNNALSQKNNHSVNKDLSQKDWEEHYKQMVEDIFQTSKGHLYFQTQIKRKLQNSLFSFFITFVVVQYVFLVVFLFLKSFCPGFGLSDAVIIAYISSVFVETLGAVFAMVKYAFDSRDEVKLVEILNQAIPSYQKRNHKLVDSAADSRKKKNKKAN